MNRVPRLALLPDFPEEGWPSMDLCAEMLLGELERGWSGRVEAVRLAPRFHHRFARLPGLGRRRTAVNADRLLNRIWEYPRFLRHCAGEFDLFHICDHSHAHLVHALPPERTGVFCHDLDTFRCLLEPASEPRPRWFQAMARRILAGLQKAAVVFYSSGQVRGQIERHRLLEPARLVPAPYGIAPEFLADPERKSEVDGPTGRPYLLHVGSCIPRKRIDVLLDVFAEARARRPELRLVKAGGEWTPEQLAQIDRLRLAPDIMHRPGVGRPELARLYRQASAVLLTSEAEGFGLPVIEALACGSIVLASDLPALRETGGAAAIYLPVGDVAQWSERVGDVLARPETAPPFEERRRQAARFTWREHARIIAETYLSRWHEGK